MTEKRQPWIKFYPTDWRAEPRLRLVSRAARSLWLDMLGIMHEATPYGFLLVEGIAPTTAQLANLVGDPEREVKKLLAELRTAGVPSIVGEVMPEDVEVMLPPGVADGTLLSRRMVRDAAKRERDKSNGKGGGNPTLKGDNRGVNPQTEKRPKNWRGGLRPRSQRPETRLPPSPPAASVEPPPPDPGWDRHRDRAVAVFGKKFCDFNVFPSRLVLVADGDWALEAPSRLIAQRLKDESMRLHELLGGTVKFTISEQMA